MLPSNFSPHAGDFENILKQYEKIGSLRKGEKLAVDLSNQDLAISQGSVKSYTGLFIQGISRKVGSWIGYGADWPTVAKRIESLNALTDQLINYYKMHPREISIENMDVLKQKISEAAVKLKQMGETAYASYNKKEAREKFLALAIGIQTIVQNHFVSDKAFFKAENQENFNKDDLEVEENDLVLIDPLESDFDKLESSDTYFASLSKQDFLVGYQGEKEKSERTFKESKEGKESENLSTFIPFISNNALFMSEQKTRLIDSQFISFTSLEEKDDGFIRSLKQEKMDDSFVYIKETHEIISEEFSVLSHKFFELKKVKKFISQMEKEFGYTTLLNDQLRQQQIKLIKIALERIDLSPQDALFKEKQLLITELITLALCPPLMPNGSALTIISFDKLMECLKQLEKEPQSVIKQLDPRYFQEDNTSSQKIYLLSHLNFSNPKAIKHIQESSIYETLYYSPALPLFLMNTRIHVPQTYRQTCIGTAYNLWFQRKCGTISEMLVVAKEAVELTQNKLNQINFRDRQSPAYQVIQGQAPTKEAYVNHVLNTVNKRLKVLEEKAQALAKMNSPNPQAVSQLTREWNFIMQDIDMILDPNNPRVFSYQYLPNHYYLSAALSAILTGAGQFISGNPKVEDRWRAICQTDLQQFAEVFFGKQKKNYVYRHEYLDSLVAPTLQEISTDQIWNKLMEEGGCFLDFTFFPFSGHTMFVTANFDNIHKKKVFDLYDPMDNMVVQMSQEKFKNFLEKSYEKKSMTNAMYTYKL